MYKFCKNCGEVLAKDRLYNRHCSRRCRDASLPPEERYGRISVTECEMLDLSVTIAYRKSELLHARKDRELEDWEHRLWSNLTSVQDKIDLQLMRINQDYIRTSPDDVPSLRVIRGDQL